jgi:methyl-accepting chemotaxis protein
VEKAKNRRKLKNFILNKKQLTIVLISTVYFFLSLSVILAVIIAPVYNDIFQSNEATIQREAAREFILLSGKLATALTAIFIITVVPLIGLTHRIFGPMINFSNIFQRVADGDLTARIYLRRADLLKSEAGQANEMIQSLAKTISEIKEQHHHLVRTLNGIIDARGTGKDLHGELQEAGNRAQTCEKLLSRFQTAEMSDADPPHADSPETPGRKSHSSNS